MRQKKANYGYGFSRVIDSFVKSARISCETGGLEFRICCIPSALDDPVQPPSPQVLAQAKVSPGSWPRIICAAGMAEWRNGGMAEWRNGIPPGRSCLPPSGLRRRCSSAPIKRTVWQTVPTSVSLSHPGSGSGPESVPSLPHPSYTLFLLAVSDCFTRLV